MSSNSPQQGQYPDSWPLSVDQKAIVHASERLHLQRPDDLATNPIIPDEVVRAKTIALFNRLEGLVSPEQQEFMDRTSEQYDTGFAAWKSIFQISAKDLTTLAKKDDVMKWAATIQPETLLGLKQCGDTPRLKLLPDMEVAKLMQVIDQHPTIPGQNKGYIGWNQWKKVKAPPGSFGLTTDIEDMPFDPTIFYKDAEQEVKRTNEEMVAEYRRRFEQTPGATIMPQYACLGSVMDAMARGQVYDKQFYTAYERPQGADNLPRATWNGDHVYLRGSVPVGSNDALRGRVWVPGKKA
ncbi:hypothetical protein KAZ92_01035 [Candidatus Gracilibacteria bacterium]|nr:hypothetical protein [Candidatus Gracilibacteria bacterium]